MGSGVVFEVVVLGRSGFLTGGLDTVCDGDSNEPTDWRFQMALSCTDLGPKMGRDRKGSDALVGAIGWSSVSDSVSSFATFAGCLPLDFAELV